MYNKYDQEEVHAKEGQVVAGFAIGIIVLGGGRTAYFPGDICNASTFHFPVYYQVADISVESVVSTKRDPVVLEKIIAAGKELERQGCRAIVGGCGYFANYMPDVADAMEIPVFLSSLMQIPMISRAIKTNQKIGIICADSKALSPSTLKLCGVTDLSRIVVAGAQDLSQIQNLMQCKGYLNRRILEQELVDFSKHLVNDQKDIGAILIECSNMPPYACAIQEAVGLPVFDFITMINWIYDAVVRHRFIGII